MTTRTRTHSALKWLANERGAVLGELEAAKATIATLQLREQRLQQQLNALDETVKRFDESLDPSSIRPVRAWKESNNGRGRMKAFFLEHLRLAGPQGLTTPALAELWAVEIGTPLAAPDLGKRFIDHRVRPQLRRLAQQGLAANLGAPDGSSRCRWVLADLLTTREVS